MLQLHVTDVLLINFNAAFLVLCVYILPQGCMWCPDRDSTFEERREHWFSSDTQFSLMVTASAGRQNLVRGGTFLTISSRRLGEEMGAAKLFLCPLKGYDGNQAKKQRAGSVKVQINDNHTSYCKTSGRALSVLLEQKQPSNCKKKEQHWEHETSALYKPAEKYGKGPHP